jgi:hypothetical protein
VRILCLLNLTREVRPFGVRLLNLARDVRPFGARTLLERFWRDGIYYGWVEIFNPILEDALSDPDKIREMLDHEEEKRVLDAEGKGGRGGM